MDELSPALLSSLYWRGGPPLSKDGAQQQDHWNGVLLHQLLHIQRKGAVSRGSVRPKRVQKWERCSSVHCQVLTDRCLSDRGIGTALLKSCAKVKLCCKSYWSSFSLSWPVLAAGGCLAGLLHAGPSSIGLEHKSTISVRKPRWQDYPLVHSSEIQPPGAQHTWTSTSGNWASESSRLSAMLTWIDTIFCPCIIIILCFVIIRFAIAVIIVCVRHTYWCVSTT